MDKAKTYFNIFIILLVFSFIGCSGATYDPPKQHNVETSKNINKQFDELWGKTVEWFATHNSPIKTMDKASGLIATDYNLTVSNYKKYCDCGKYENGDLVIGEYTNPVGNFNILVKKIDDNSTKISINCFFSVIINEYSTNLLGTKKDLIASNKVDCTSNGSLEKEIFEYLK